MFWNKWATWYKGAIIGLIAGLFFTGFMLTNKFNPGNITCNALTQCTGNVCNGCLVIGLMFNLIYGFIIGGLIGYICQKCIEKKGDKKKENLNVKKNKSKKKRK